MHLHVQKKRLTGSLAGFYMPCTGLERLEDGRIGKCKVGSTTSAN